MKRSRPLSLFLIVLILISCFTVSGSAADSDNLVSDDLRYWQNYDPEYSSVNVLGNSPDINYITIKPQTDSDGINTKVSYFYELPKLVSGNSYTFNFNLLDLAQCQELGLAWTSTHLYYGFLNNNAFLLVGLASYVQGENRFELVEGSSIVIDKTNYLKYYGGSNSISFELPNIVNPCIVISYTEINSSPYNTYIVMKDISLVDNSQAEQDSFFAKLFDWFQEKFDSIGDSFTNLVNKLTELKNSFLDSLSNLGDTIGSFFDEQLEGIIDFFRGFGNLILYFNWEGEYTNPFEREDSPIDKVSEFFDNLIEYVDSIGTSIENVLDSITGGLHIFDEFTSRFPWLKGIAVFCLALIVITRFIGL